MNLALPKDWLWVSGPLCVGLCVYILMSTWAYLVVIPLWAQILPGVLHGLFFSWMILASEAEIGERRVRGE